MAPRLNLCPRRSPKMQWSPLAVYWLILICFHLQLIYPSRTRQRQESPHRRTEVSSRGYFNCHTSIIRSGLLPYCHSWTLHRASSPGIRLTIRSPRLLPHATLSPTGMSLQILNPTDTVPQFQYRPFQPNHVPHPLPIYARLHADCLYHRARAVHGQYPHFEAQWIPDCYVRVK